MSLPRKLWHTAVLFAWNLWWAFEEWRRRPRYDYMSDEWRPERRTYRDDV